MDSKFVYTIYQYCTAEVGLLPVIEPGAFLSTVLIGNSTLWVREITLTPDQGILILNDSFGAR